MNVLYKKTVKVQQESSVVDIGWLLVCELWTHEDCLPEHKAYIVTFVPARGLIKFPFPVYMTRNRDNAIEFATEYQLSDKIENVNRIYSVKGLL